MVFEKHTIWLAKDQIIKQHFLENKIEIVQHAFKMQ
jgi:hypothetical protein